MKALLLHYMSFSGGTIEYGLKGGRSNVERLRKLLGMKILIQPVSIFM